MEVTLGKEGLKYSWQEVFSETTECCYCKSEARIAFVAHEEMTAKVNEKQFVGYLHQNKVDEMWVHDYCSVAVYFCKKCLKAVAVMNQG